MEYGNAALNVLAQQAGDGFAIANDLVLEDLQKALSAGYGTDAASFTGGRSLMPESLDTTLVSVLHSVDESKLFQRLKKEPVGSTVHQWTKRTEVGADEGVFVSEGGTSQTMNQTLARKTLNMKYIQTKREVTLQMATAKSIEDAQALEQNAGMLQIVRVVEKNCFTGNATHVTEQFDGLEALLTTNVIDMRGKDATTSTFEDKMSEGCRRIRNYFGKATLSLSSTMVMEDQQKLLRDRLRVRPGKETDGATVFDFYPTKFGRPELQDDVFLQEGSTPVTGSLAGIPTVPTVNSIAAAALAGGYFVAADAGTYYYKIVATNAYGDSVATAGSSVVVAAGDRVTINVTGGATLGTCYKIYRSKKNAADATDCRYMKTVTYTGAAQNLYDTNSDLPGTSSVYLLNMDPNYDAIEWNQFLPAMKFQLYPNSSAVYPFLVLLFGALAVKKEEQCVRIRNVGYSGLSWF